MTIERTPDSIKRVGDGVDEATLNKHGDRNGLEVDSDRLAVLLSSILDELRAIREFILTLE